MCTCVATSPGIFFISSRGFRVRLKGSLWHLALGQSPSNDSLGFRSSGSISLSLSLSKGDFARQRVLDSGFFL